MNYFYRINIFQDKSLIGMSAVFLGAAAAVLLTMWSRRKEVLPYTDTSDSNYPSLIFQALFIFFAAIFNLYNLIYVLTYNEYDDED